MGIEIVKDGYCRRCTCCELELLDMREFDPTLNLVRCIHEEACDRMRKLVSKSDELSTIENILLQ